MEDALRAGIALYNAGHYRTAHDAWEHPWIGMSSRNEQKDFLQGLIQYTVAIHHAISGNEAGARNLAANAPSYLDGYPASFAGVDLEPVRRYLEALRSDPTCVERRDPPTLTHRGDAVTFENLDLEATLLAIEALAESEGDEELVDRAIEYARADLDAGEEGSRYIALLFDYVRESGARGTVRQRLSEHVDRRSAREGDVDGLFD